MTFASLENIHSSILYNTEWVVTYWWKGELKKFTWTIWQGFESVRQVRETYKIRMHDKDDPNKYHYLDYAINIEEGGKLKGDNDDKVIVGTLGDDKIIGKAGDDILHGDDVSKTIWLGGNDKLFGGGGDDTAYVYHGNDLLKGGKGNDTLDGGHGQDILYDEDGLDTLHGGGGQDKLYGGKGKDLLFGNDGNDILNVDGGADTLLGGAGDDKLNGGAGDDLLIGGFGNDMLTGGQGRDIFVLEDPLSYAAKFFTSMTDTVTDFDIGVDKIRVYQKWIDKGWVSIGVSEAGSGKKQLSVTIKKNLSDAEYLYLQEHGELPAQAEASVPSKMLLANIADADFTDYMRDGGGLGIADSNNMLLDIV